MAREVTKKDKAASQKAEGGTVKQKQVLEPLCKQIQLLLYLAQDTSRS